MIITNSSGFVVAHGLGQEVVAPSGPSKMELFGGLAYLRPILPNNLHQFRL